MAFDGGVDHLEALVERGAGRFLSPELLSILFSSSSPYEPLITRHEKRSPSYNAFGRDKNPPLRSFMRDALYDYLVDEGSFDPRLVLPKRSVDVTFQAFVNSLRGSKDFSLWEIESLFSREQFLPYAEGCFHIHLKRDLDEELRSFLSAQGYGCVKQFYSKLPFPEVSSLLRSRAQSPDASLPFAIPPTQPREEDERPREEAVTVRLDYEGLLKRLYPSNHAPAYDDELLVKVGEVYSSLGLAKMKLMSDVVRDDRVLFFLEKEYLPADDSVIRFLASPPGSVFLGYGGPPTKRFLRYVHEHKEEVFLALKKKGLR